MRLFHGFGHVLISGVLKNEHLNEKINSAVTAARVKYIKQSSQSFYSKLRIHDRQNYHFISLIF